MIGGLPGKRPCLVKEPSWDYVIITNLLSVERVLLLPTAQRSVLIHVRVQSSTVSRLWKTGGFNM